MYARRIGHVTRILVYPGRGNSDGYISDYCNTVRGMDGP